MEFAKNQPLYSYEVKREGGEDILYINYVGAPFVPSLAEYPQVMEHTVSILTDNPNVSRIIFVQQKNYNYDQKETFYLVEIAQIHTFLSKQEEILSQKKIGNDANFPKRYNELFNFLFMLKSDPIGAYLNIKNIYFENKIMSDRMEEGQRFSIMQYLYLLEKITKILEDSALVKESLSLIDSISVSNREIYQKLFKPDILPNFTFTRLVSHLPSDAEIVNQYKIKSSDYDESIVTILKNKDESKLTYHLLPPEHLLKEDHNILLNLARSVLIEHQPKAEEFIDTKRTRQVFFNISRDLIRDLAQSKEIPLDYNELNKLAGILVRHTIGFGLLEVLLQDDKLQDIVLNAPIPKNPVFVRHNDYDECSTNILPSQEDADSWSAKFRMASGRPLDESSPILDTQIEFNNIRSRVAIIQQPLSPDGLSYAFRRHRQAPWTLPLFVKYKMLNPFAAGLFSFLIDGSRTLLIAGTRSSGKTSVLGSLMLEIMPRYRIIVIEDSLELPVEALRDLNYDILSMKVRSALLKTTNEVSADEGIRTSLRLGDSSLIIGEVRSTEAKALYEAMRVGALANVVAGTIHGGSPYSIFDRVVNDLEVPITSFKATDLIAIANPIKSPDGLHSMRRLLQITEVRKHWKSDPLEEKGFVDLMKYNVEEDELKPSDDLINGDVEVIKDIASNVKGWSGNWDAVYDNILLRSKIKEEIVKTSDILGRKDLLEARFVSLSNDSFHKISDKVRQEIGLPLGNRVFPEWQKWMNEKIKGKSF